MKTGVARLTPAAEFSLIIGVAFGYFIVGGACSLGRGTTRVTLSDGSVLGLLAFELVALALVGALLLARGWSFAELRIRPTIRSTLMGIVLFGASILVYWAAVYAVWLLTGSLDVVYVVRLESTVSLPFAVLASVINPLFEESIVVVYVLRSLRTHWGPVAVAASALIRLSYHLYQGPLAVVGILPSGILWATYYWRRQRSWPLFVAHSLGRPRGSACGADGCLIRAREYTSRTTTRR